MADAGTIIKDAMQDISVLGAGKSPTTNDNTDCLRKLNDMLDSWSTSTILVPFRTQVSHTLNGSESYTIGSSGDINTTRPTAIESAYVRHDGIDHPMRVSHDRSEYDRIHDKDITGFPSFLYYEPQVPLGKLFVWYTGDSSYTLYLNTRGQLTQFPDTSTAIDIASGYKRAITKNLSIEIAPMYEASVSNELATSAKDALSKIKRLNRQLPVMSYDAAISSRNQYNIETR